MQTGMSMSVSADAMSRSKRSSWSPSVSHDAKENQAGALNPPPLRTQIRLLSCNLPLSSYTVLTSKCTNQPV
jgi:hypothetical protein